MKRLLIVSLVGIAASTASQAMAESKDEKKEKPAGHCEKTKADGSTEDIEAKDKADCKAKGGKWNKKAKGAHSHDHKEGDGDDHK
jgi:hypothetical protein